MILSPIFHLNLDLNFNIQRENNSSDFEVSDVMYSLVVPAFYDTATDTIYTSELQLGKLLYPRKQFITHFSIFDGNIDIYFYCCGKDRTINVDSRGMHPHQVTERCTARCSITSEKRYHSDKK